jgi:GNAT acetyltransferase-like protein
METEMKHPGWSEVYDDKEWDQFVVESNGSIFHLWSWGKVVKSENSKLMYLGYRGGNGALQALCPFVLRPGRRLLYLDSLPDSHVAGPIIGREAPGMRQVIASLPKSVRFSLRNPIVAMRIRVHQPEMVRTMIDLGFRYDLTYALFLVDLQDKTPEHIWKDGFGKHDRQAVKYYDQRSPGFQISDKDNDYSDFLSLSRGSSTHDVDREAFVSRLRNNMGDRLRVATVRENDKAIAGVLVLRDTSSSAIRLMMMRFSPTRNIHSPVTYLNWKAVNWAQENGFRYFDFGSYYISAASNPEHFIQKLKARFEASLVPRYHFVLPVSSISYSIASKVSRVI